MKTLDEVIEALEVCTSGYCSNRDGDCPYLNIDNDCDTRLRKLDALFYLKSFRDTKNALDAERERAIEAYCQWQDAKEKLEAQTSQMMWVDKHFQFEISDNPPLTWDELKQMEGKPVWVEELCNGSRWYGFWDVVSDAEDYGDEKTVYTKSEMKYEMAEYGTTWQAYRKER